MSVYVDSLRPTTTTTNWRYRYSCHLFADDHLELIDFAVVKLGLKTEWYQNHRYPHFDITASKRAKAIRLGAQEITTREWLLKHKQIIT